MKFVYILIGGAVGSLLRYLAIDFISSKNTIDFPLGTFSVNIIGSLIIGFLFGLFSINGQLDDKLKYLIFIGFLGGFTTFSSYALENVNMLSSGFFSNTVLYILLSNCIGIALAYAGYGLALKIR